ncbi:DUF1674 domain-containing protein [Alkalilimnicola ehrlichii MLHE-1]|uniref:DUF1674 domain-containing protein n=1 Tax=Alkalilimnicola ehrlichii (strain ATCC BAA-1101 / DSM 17681 / MLHE-1) TaxID=187272 RepID=Q0A907_ALKEH|nr:succinate dehydrogenase assembly factor 4 [Alkalilimnicola ehrlichii]ABI56680.1 protein of unknown function DUF1674 [Alkalilimnicola ehrlichii MLHE-1]
MRKPDAEQQPVADSKNDARDDTTGAVAAGDGRPKEIGGPKGPEPTRYGDWERNGRCSDF